MEKRRKPDIKNTTLEEAGYEVIIATDSGRLATRDYQTNEKTVNMGDVKVADYVGFILPSCSPTAPISAESIAVVERAVAEGKIVAAQRWGILTLAEAGALRGKRYTFPSDPKDSEYEITFADANYVMLPEGEYFVRDGNIITSPL
jgi:putative intracellular protease/amidase